MSTIGSLFSGIGGLELGLERAGLGRVVFQVERDPYCRAVLAKHWPDAERFDDVQTFHPGTRSVSVLCGGFPCQDISSANTASKRLGLAGARSGLWGEYRRIISELHPPPEWIIVENSPRWEAWVPTVRSDLSALGYASLPLVVSASFVGAPHHRPRGFVVAHTDSEGESLRAFHAEVAQHAPLPGPVWNARKAPPGGFRVDDGVPTGTCELAAYGNACVPQVAEVIGRAILAASCHP
jgi:DNA (cytosine-5)-methyltransferase 1